MKRPVIVYEKFESECKSGYEKQLCEFAIPGKEYLPSYQFSFKCGVMYQCMWKSPTIERKQYCPRYKIGKNKLDKGAELLKISNGAEIFQMTKRGIEFYDRCKNKVNGVNRKEDMR